jgi:hypothetical protein
MPGLVHDLALVLSSFGGRGCEAGAQRVSAERFGRESCVTDMALDDQGNAGIGQPAIHDLAVLADRPEDRAGGDLCVAEPRPQQGNRAGGRSAALGCGLWNYSS